MALIMILDIPPGKPEAIINATHLTDMKTGAAGAIACKYLSGKKEVVLGLFGTGRQAQVTAIGEEITISGSGSGAGILCMPRGFQGASKG